MKVGAKMARSVTYIGSANEMYVKKETCQTFDARVEHDTN